MYCGEREPQWLIFGNFFCKSTSSVHVWSRQVFRPIGVLKKFTQLRNSNVKYKFIFYRASSAPLSVLKLPFIGWGGGGGVNCLVVFPTHFSFNITSNLTPIDVYSTSRRTIQRVIVLVISDRFRACLILPNITLAVTPPNRPFARSGHMVRNKLCRDINNEVGLSNQRNVRLDW